MANLIDRAIESFKRVGEGLKTVFIHSFREPTTQVYPDKIEDLAPHFRGRLALTVNPDTGDHLCISCRQCERVCPDKCIEITAHKSPETNKLELINFKIDHGLCMFCGLCTEVCPTQCIINTNDFEMADYSRESLIYDIKRLTLTQDESSYYFDKKEMPKPKPKPKPGAKPAAKPGAGAAAKPAAGAAAKPAAKADEKKADAKPAAKADEKKADAKPAAKVDEKKADAKPAAKADEKKADDKPAVKADEKKAAPKDKEKKADSEPKAEAKDSDKDDKKEDKS